MCNSDFYSVDPKTKLLKKIKPGYFMINKTMAFFVKIVKESRGKICRTCLEKMPKSTWIIT